MRKEKIASLENAKDGRSRDLTERLSGMETAQRDAEHLLEYRDTLARTEQQARHIAGVDKSAQEDVGELMSQINNMVIALRQELDPLNSVLQNHGLNGIGQAAKDLIDKMQSEIKPIQSLLEYPELVGLADVTREWIRATADEARMAVRSQMQNEIDDAKQKIAKKEAENQDIHAKIKKAEDDSFYAQSRFGSLNEELHAEQNKVAAQKTEIENMKSDNVALRTLRADNAEQLRAQQG